VRVTYLLPCACGAQIRVTSVQAGESVQCPSCGTSVTAPPWREMAELKTADETPPRRRRSRWGAREIWIMVGLYLAAGSLIVIAVQWARCPQDPDPSGMSPLQSWQTWMAVRQGLGRRVSWMTFAIIEARRNLWLTTYACTATALLGLGISLFAFLRRRRRVPLAPIDAAK
jgi:hypothetical protein